MKHVFVKTLINEVVVTEGYGKYLLIAMFFNIPFWGFIPYVTQAITIILLGFFLKNHLISDKLEVEKMKKLNKVKFTTKPIAKILTYTTIGIQLIWIPFLLQLITLTLLSIIYANFTKYSK